MAEAKQIAQFNSFVGGMITESTELTFPPNATSNELNCELFTKGNRTRRRGLDFENDYSVSSFTITNPNLSTLAIFSGRWTSVGGVGERSFTVVQVGSMLYFYDNTNVLSSGEKSFSVDLDDYLAPAASSAATEVISMASGRGDLFVVSPLIEPIRIVYNVNTDTITTSLINIRVRDFEGVDDGLEVDEEPAVLTPEHEYNLKNQGWYVTPFGWDNIQIYRNEQGVYPSNNLQWHTAVKVHGDPIAPGIVVSTSTVGQVNSYGLRKLAIGNGEAPKGHYILDPFNKNRSAVSGVSGLTTETVTERPVCVAFYAGRVVYAFQGDVYMSQVLNRSRDNAGKCYQEMDPTSEDLSDLVATDGVVIPIPEAGNILAMDVVGSTLLLFANNGVWAIAGTDGGFKATDFSIGKVTGSGIVGRTGLVNAEGTLIWWSDSGIYGIQTEQISGQPAAQNLTDQTIKTFYLGIDNESRRNAVGKYDPATKTVSWLYSSSPLIGKHVYDRVLRLNLNLGAFYPWDIPNIVDDGVRTPRVCGVTDLAQLSREEGQTPLYDSEGNFILTSTDEIITYTSVSFTTTSTFVKYLCLVPESFVDYKITFGGFINNSLTDWETYAILEGLDKGVSFNSYADTGYDLQNDLTRQKQAPYIIVHSKRTETGYDTNTEEWTNPSGLFLQGRWDFADHYRAGKWSVVQQVYKILSKDIPTESTGDYDFGNAVITSRVRIRGRGRALQLRFQSDGDKDFNILGWGIIYTGNTEV